MTRFIKRSAQGILALFLLVSSTAGIETRAHAETPSSGVIEIQSATQTHRFEVEIADEPSERARGLMFREFLPAGDGMLFIYPREQISSFWMKNTLISLDMLFITNNGEIVQISPRATPGSLDSVRSDRPVRAVLEINGGLADALSIAVGDTVKLFRKNPANQ